MWSLSESKDGLTSVAVEDISEGGSNAVSSGDATTREEVSWKNMAGQDAWAFKATLSVGAYGVNRCPARAVLAPLCDIESLAGIDRYRTLGGRIGRRVEAVMDLARLQWSSTAMIDTIGWEAGLYLDFVIFLETRRAACGLAGNRV
jgi:hypothetical protein